jgi:hypothetical protein
MTNFKFPKSFRNDRGLFSANVDELIPVTFNETDVDRMMTQVAERLVRAGRHGPSTKTSLTGLDGEVLTVRSLALALQKSPRIVGFGDRYGAEALEGWLRSSLLIVKGQGKSRTGEVLDYLAPLTAASYRTGLPKNPQRNRRADELIYSLMRSYLDNLGVEAPAQLLRRYAQESIGKGVDFGMQPHRAPAYDGVSRIDINQLLALRLIELFQPSDAGTKPEKKDEFSGLAIPGAVIPFARDLVSLFQVMAGEGGAAGNWTTSDSFSALRSVIAIRLFQIPLRMGGAIRSAIETQEHSDLWSRLPEEEANELLQNPWENPLQLYCDFTDVAGSASDQLAKNCVARDLDALRLFFRDRMLFRAVVQSASQTGGKSPFKGDPDNPPNRREVFSNFLSGLGQEDYLRAATWYLNVVEETIRNPEEGERDEQSLRTLENARKSSPNALLAFGSLIAASREREGVEGLVKWLKATGGLQSVGMPKGYAILKGTEGHRATWKYRPADELILNLCDMCFLDPPISPERPVALSKRKKMPLRELLKRLRSRYGLLIDAPPGEFNTPEFREAASENLKAFTAILRDSGSFETLSDDFAGQMVARPRRMQ